ncbi:Uncharacterised protein [Citrobacter freundii]|nr:Uncharacterised protein [Citrobacter freundii]
MGYSFTSPEVVSALVNAKRRGVDVKVVLDWKANTGQKQQRQQGGNELAGRCRHSGTYRQCVQNSARQSDRERRPPTPKWDRLIILGQQTVRIQKTCLSSGMTR